MTPGAASGAPLIELDAVTKTYAGGRSSLWRRSAPVAALDTVSLTLRRGESVAIVGESGAGKTTLVRLLLGLSTPTSGSVRFDGRAVDQAGARLSSLRRRTGLVFQDPHASFNPRRTIGQSVAEPLEGAAHSGDHGELVADALRSVGLRADDGAKYPHELSGGQRQRAAIARAIVHGPELVIGDEPVSALDVLVRSQVLSLLERLRDERGLTLVTITHDLGIVPRIAERTIVMQRGRIVEDGATARVLAHPEHPYTRSLLAARLPFPGTGTGTGG